MQIIATDGTYNFTRFAGKNGIWSLIGVKSEGREIIDTFKSDKGEYKEINRKLISQLQASGDIWPVSELSKI